MAASPKSDGTQRKDPLMNWLLRQLAKIRLLQGDFDYKLVRASMVIILSFFGYQKWFDYEAQELIPFFTLGPLIFWMPAVFGSKGSTYFLGVSESPRLKDPAWNPPFELSTDT
jgi:uncharacterized membrane protein YkgB